MAFQDTLFDTGLDAMVARADQASLHTADPGATGANEVTGGTYARQSITWDAATGASVSISAPFSFDVPAGNTIEWVGLWESGTATWLGAIALASPEPFANDGELTVQNMTITAVNA